jgi:hypothetical protein
MNPASDGDVLDPDTLALVLAQNDAPPPPGAGAPPPPPPPPPGRAGGPGLGGPGMPRPGMPGPRPSWGHDWHHPPLFGLFFQREDKQLTPADVQKIAEAFLLWQGNRDWKVTQVAALPDGRIAFDLATADGGVIAKFTMDGRTGRIQRIG